MKSARIKLLFAAAALVLIGAGCVDGSDNGYGSSDYSEPENPYSGGSGHSAGYDWAERTGGSCNGNSNSFNEGCEEYYRQMENE